MKKFNLILLPIHEDIAGNKRLKNIAKYLEQRYSASTFIFESVEKKYKTASSNRFRYCIFRIFIFFFDTISFIKILVKQRNKKAYNFVYFYEGQHLFFLRVVFAKLLGYRILVDLVENPNPLAYTHSWLRKLRIVYFIVMYRLMPYYASGIIVITRFLRDKIKKDFKHPIPIYLLPVSYDPENFLVSDTKTSSFSLFYGGSYGDNYDFISFIDALSNICTEFHDIKLYLGCNPGNKILEYIERNIPNEECIIKLDYLPEEQYFSMLSSMHTFCVPRNNSIHANAGFPFKLAEYLATGNPVITSGVSDVTEYLNENDAFIYEPGNSKQIAEFLRIIITDEKRAQKVGQSGKQKADIYFNAEKQAESLMNFIASLIK